MPLRPTAAMCAVAATLLASPDAPHWGYRIGQATGLSAGTLYPLLSRLSEVGWLEWQWESHSEGHDPGRPARRYYLLTATGREELASLVANVAAGSATGVAPIAAAPQSPLA